MPHIPQGTTDTLTLELFDPALESALRPLSLIHISEPTRPY